MMSMPLFGTIDRFDTRKGFGFIEHDELGQNIYVRSEYGRYPRLVHTFWRVTHNGHQEDRYHRLRVPKPGDKVVFSVYKSVKGFRADSWTFKSLWDEAQNMPVEWRLVVPNTDQCDVIESGSVTADQINTLRFPAQPFNYEKGDIQLKYRGQWEFGWHLSPNTT